MFEINSEVRSRGIVCEQGLGDRHEYAMHCRFGTKFFTGRAWLSCSYVPHVVELRLLLPCSASFVISHACQFSIRSQLTRARFSTQ